MHRPWYDFYMIFGIDIGGTKTLLGLFTEAGELIKSEKFPTPADYLEFVNELEIFTKSFMGTTRVHQCVVAVPGLVDRDKGVAAGFGNLAWLNVPIADDVATIVECNVVLENDAKMAALAEAVELKGVYSRVLYVTISTGIGPALVVDCKIDHAIADGGGRNMLLEHNGSIRPWEEFASGKAIKAQYGSIAADINDPEIWKDITELWVVGFIELITLTSPDVIVIGGGVGTHFKKYGKFLRADLKQYETPMLKVPPIRQAKRPEEAVIYGCYQLAVQK